MSAFLGLFLSVCLAYLLGSLTLGALKYPVSERYRAISALSLGLGLLVSLLALGLRAGQTVFIWSLPALIWWGYRFRAERETASTNQTTISVFLRASKDLSPFVLAFIAWFTWYYYQYTNYVSAEGLGLRPLHPDLLWYARLSQQMRDFGVENLLGSLNLNPSLSGIVQPYHYADLYLVQFLGLGQASNILFSTLVTGPALVMALGAWALYLFAGSQSTKAYFFPVLASLFVGMHGLKLPFFPEVAGNFSLVIHSHAVLKYASAWYFGLLVLMLMWHRRPEWYALLVLLPLSNFTYFPAILGGLSLYSLGAIWLNKTEARRKRLGMDFLVLLVVNLGMFVWYQVYAMPPDFAPPEAKLSVALQETKLNYMTSLKLFVGSSIHFFGDYALHILVGLGLYYGLRPSERPLLGLSARFWIWPLTFISGLGAWALLRTLVNSYQLFHSLISSFSNAFLAFYALLLLGAWIRHRPFWGWGLTLGLSGAILVSILSPGWAFDSSRFKPIPSACTELVEQALPASCKRLGVFAPAQNNIEVYPHFAWLDHLRPGLIYLPMHSELFESGNTASLAPSLLGSFMAKQVQTEDQKRAAYWAFVAEYQIEYLLLHPKASLPPWLEAGLELQGKCEQFSLYKMLGKG